MRTTIDLIPILEFSRDDKIIYGPIMGAIAATVLGVVLGTTLSYAVSVYQRKVIKNRDDIAASSKKIQKELTYLGQLVDNVALLNVDLINIKKYVSTMLKGLEGKPEDRRVYYNKLPIPTLVNQDISKVINADFMHQWRVLHISVRDLAADIHQFSDFYSQLQSNAKKYQDPDESLEQVIVLGGRTILSSLKSIDQNIHRLMALGDLITNYATSRNINLVKDSSEAIKIIQDIYNFSPSDKEIEMKSQNYNFE